jgi:hypothetical protein
LIACQSAFPDVIEATMTGAFRPSDPCVEPEASYTTDSLLDGNVVVEQRFGRPDSYAACRRG